MFLFSKLPPSSLCKSVQQASPRRFFGNRRVVVTGIGLICPLGVGKAHVWNRLIKGDVNFSKLDDERYQNIPSKVAALIPRGKEVGELNLSDHLNTSELKSISLATAYSLIAAKEALEDANWKPVEKNDLENTGVAIGMGMIDLEDIINVNKSLEQKGYKKVSPFFVPRILVNMAAGHISIKHGFQGPNHSVSTACATGNHSIGDAFNFIRNNYAEVMVCGSTEAAISPLSIAGFSRLRALSTLYNDSPEKSSRPFDKGRDGFVMGEGAGVLILESLDHALKRGAKPYAEMLGYGLSGDASHITSPSTDGNGAFRCMNNALKNASLSPEDIGYINAHATSTPLGDVIEAKAIKSLFKAHSLNMMISSTKGSVGHLLGAAGSVEAIFTILACQSGIIPPTLNLDAPDEEVSDLNIIQNSSANWPTDSRIALTNSFGFGGTNACLALRNFCP